MQNNTTSERDAETVIREAIGWHGIYDAQGVARRVIGELYAAGYQIIPCEVINDG